MSLRQNFDGPYRPVILSKWGVATAALLLLMSGCGLPTWNELIGANQPAPQPIVQQPPVIIQPAPTPTPAPPPKPDPQVVIDNFKSLQPHQINDNTLLALASLESGLEQITELKLGGTEVTEKGLRDIEKLTSLAKLDIRGSLLGEGAYAQIADSPSIQSLYLDGSRVTNESAAALKPLSQLKVLFVHRVNLMPIGWQDLLLSHPDLEELEIMQSNINDLTMSIVGRLKKLKVLTLNDSQVTDEGLAQLAGLEGLKHLNVSGCQIRGIGFRPPGGSRAFQSLEELLLQRCPLDERGAKAIMTMKELKRLNISDLQNMQDIHFKAMIRPLNNLELVRFNTNVVLTGQCLSAFTGSEAIQELDFSNCRQIDDSGLRHLTKCPNLRVIHIHNTACTTRGVLALREFLPNLEVVGLQQ